MKVLVQFMTSSLPVTFENVKDVYTKDALLCLSFIDSKRIIKYPLCNVFSIESDYQSDGHSHDK